jgi:hypothetical protein
MKREVAWKYKALIYGTLTFLMLVSVFLAFAYYDNHWKMAHTDTSTDSRTTRRGTE